MYRTKQDVDRHVSSVLARIKDQKERNARGYQIAKLYYEAKEYEIARRYLAGFLSIRENLPQAHKLMGMIHEACGQTAQAVASYKRSLELDDKQKDVVYKICEQYTKTGVDPDRAKFWAEKGEKLFPNSEVVFKLKERAVSGQGNQNFKDMEGLISAELVKRPGDVDLRVRLLKLYASNGRVNEAYDHATEVEQTLAYVDSLPWYEYLVDLLATFQREAGCAEDTLFYSIKLSAIQNLTTLTLQHRDVVESAEALHLFDLCLQQAFQIHKPSQEWQALLAEMQGQFFYLAGTLLLKRAQRNQLTWRDATCVSSASYIVSHQFPPLKPRSEWFVRAPSNKLKTNDRLLKVSHFRCSQTGHMLNMLCRGDKTQWAVNLKQRHCTPQGKEKLYDTLFTLREMKTMKPKSYLMQSKAFCDFEISLPTTDQLAEYDSVAHLLQPSSLHFLSWLALQHYSWKDNTQPKYDFNIFSTLQYTTTTSLDNAASESLCQLDVEAFLYATVRCVALQLQESRQILPQDGSQPELLPVILCKPLCSKEQAEWWEAAYKLYANIAKENFPKLRLILQRGLEAVRLIGHHGMSVTMMVHLAKTLEERVSEMKAKPDRGCMSDPMLSASETRTAHYWQKALEVLRKMEKNQPVRSPRERLFPEDGSKELDSKMIKELIGDGEFFMAVLSMSRQDYETALAAFEKLEKPYASYHTAQVYKQLANAEVCGKTKDGLTDSIRGKYEALLIKARDAYYLTLDRLRGDKNHELNKLLSRDLDDIETRLSRADTEEGILNDSVNLSVNSEDFLSPMGLTGVQTIPIATPNRLPYLAQSTPNLKPLFKGLESSATTEESPRITMSELSRHVRPSPERLEAQMRALTFSQETLLKTVMDRNEELIRHNKEIMDELKETRSLNKQLQDQMSQFTQARLMGNAPFLPQGLSQTLPTGSPYMVGAPLQAGGFPYSPQPSWMPQYGYQMPSPNHAASLRFGSPNRLGPRQHPINHGDFYSGAAYSFATGEDQDDAADREDNEEEDPYHIDGEYFVDDGTGAQPYYLQDIHESWPYGNRAGVEGKSTISYQPHMRPPVPQAGLVGAGLRGQSLQYGYRPPAAGPTMPGPGYFSSPQTHASVYPSNTTTQSTAGGALPSNTQCLVTGQVSVPSPAAAQAMPPNVVAGQAMAAKANISTSVTNRPHVTGTPSMATTGHVVPQPAANPAQQTGAQQTPAQKPEHSSGQPSVPTLPEGVSLLFAGRAAIAANANKAQLCCLKMFHIVRGSRPVIVMQAVAETKEVVMNHELSAEVQVKPQMFVPDTFVWTKTGSTDKFTLKFSDSNETAGFNLAIEKVKVLLHNIAVAKEASVSGPSIAPAASKNTVSAPQQPPGSAAGMLSQLAAKHKEAPAQPTPVGQPVADAAKGDASKSIFGGFTFKSTPVINKPSTPGSEERQKAVPASKAISPTKTTAKPFEGFSFNLLSQSPVTPGSSETAASSKPTFPTLGGVAAGSVASPAQKSPGAKLSQTFSKDSPGRREDETTDEYEPNVDFQPVIPLPDLVDVKTGEEDEDELFNERCRLFRYDPEIKLWKERGIGEMKILQNKKTNRIRILMRRDQVLKLCANHYLSVEMKLSPMPSSEKSWCWTAVDYADEELKHEKLAARFKNVEIATQFKKVFEDSVNKMKAESEVTSTTDIDSQAAKPTQKSPVSPNKETTAEEDKKPLSELFRPAEGSWECSGCLLRNEGSVLKCPACATLKPGVKPEDVKEAPTSSSASGFKFGSAGFTFGSASSGGFSFASPAAGKDSLAKPPGGFSFGSPSTSKDTSAVTSSTATSGFSFASPAVGKEASGKPGADSTTGFTFASTAQNKDGSKPLTGNTQTADSLPSVKQEAPKTTTVPDGEPKVDSSTPLSELFKRAEGSWECTGCLLINAVNIQKCPACGTLQPGVKAEDVKPAPDSVFQISSSGFMFGSASKESSGFNIGTSTKPDSSTGFVFGGSSSGNKPSGFSFGTVNTTSEAESKTSSQGKTLKDLLQSDSPATGSSSSLLKDINQSESPNVSSTTKTPAASKSLFGSALTGPAAPVNVKGSASDSFVFGSPLTKFTFTGVGTSTPGTSAKPPSITSPKSPEVDDSGHYVNKEGEDSHIFFEPVVKLPEKVELKTGEEDEIVQFESRAKLYRFDSKEWKERGLGVVKLLQHKVTSKIRILMRRDQILKICCNHHVRADMELKPMAKMEGKAWVWHAVDFADEDHKHQKLAIRFKSPELANKFKAVFDLGRQCGSSSPLKGSLESTGVTTVNSPEKTTEKAKPQLSSDDGSDDDVIFVKEDKATPDQIAKARSYKLPDHFYLYEKAAPCPGCLGCVDGDEEEYAKLLKSSPAPVEKKSPRKPEAEKKVATSLFGSISETEPDSTTGSFSMFGNQSANISFAALAESPASPFVSKSDSGKPFAFSGAGAKLFGVGKADAGEEGHDDEVAPSNDIHFEPIISLPEMEVKTGEEDEDVLFCQRSKLFRFDKDSKQWKERGIGEMKILKHRQTGAYRILQRREQVLKISCNHLLTPDLQLKPMSTSETTWCWNAQDYAEGETKIEQFAIKFKNVALAQDFRKIFEKCQADLETRTEQAVVEEIVEPSVRGATGFVTGDKGNVYHSQQLDPKAVVEEIVEPSVRSTSGFITGNKGNVYHTQQLDQKVMVEEIVEPAVRISSGFVTGDKGNVYHTQQLDQKAVVEEIVEPSVRSSSAFVTGDKGNVYHTQQFDQKVTEEDVIEPAYRTSSAFVTGDKGNAYHTQQLDQKVVVEEIVEPSVTSTSGFITGDKGNVYHTQQLDQKVVVEEIVEPSVRSTSAFVTGDEGNTYHTHQLDQKAAVVEEIVEPALTSTAAFITGDKGNDCHTPCTQMLEKKGNLSQPLQETDQNQSNSAEGITEKGDNSDVLEQTDSKEDEPEDVEEEEDDDEYEDVDEDYEDIVETIFEKRATLSSFENNEWKVLGMGDLKVLYDVDVSAHRIAMENDQQTKMCNHIISKESCLSSDNKRTCQWAAVDFSTDEPVKQVFRAQFSSTPALTEFTNHFLKGVQLATELDISERDMMSTFPHEIVVPEVLCSPDSKDGATGFGLGGFTFYNNPYLIQSSPRTQIFTPQLSQSAGIYNPAVTASVQQGQSAALSNAVVATSADVQSSVPSLPAVTIQSEAPTEITSQPTPWLQHCLSEASASSSELSPALLGSCAPEISAALEEILREDSQAEDFGINSLD